MKLDRKWRCCGRKPVFYKGGSWRSPPGAPFHFCTRCCSEYGPDGAQRENWAWLTRPDAISGLGLRAPVPDLAAGDLHASSAGLADRLDGHWLRGRDGYRHAAHLRHLP